MQRGTEIAVRQNRRIHQRTTAAENRRHAEKLETAIATPKTEVHDVSACRWWLLLKSLMPNIVAIVARICPSFCLFTLRAIK
jgi:hypothetical protein